MRNTKIIVILQLVILLVLEYLGIFEKYVSLVFMADPGIKSKPLVKGYSFISPMVFGNGLFFPIIFVLLTFGLIILTGFQLVKPMDGDRAKKVYKLSLYNIALLVIPLLIGMQEFNNGMLVMMLLSASYAVLSFALSKAK